MKQVLIRNLDDEIFADYKQAAAQNGRSVVAELRDGLARARPKQRLVGEDLVRSIRQLWDQLPDRDLMSDSTALIREDRDSR